MDRVTSMLAVLSGMLLVAVVASAAQPLRRTTLFTAWCWALAFSLFAFVLETLDGVLAVLPRYWAELLWYLVAVVGVCPAVAVLGARRPVNRVWNLFIILPLLAVLGWPAMAVLMNGATPQRLHLEAPPLVAFGVVLLMGFGNYIGTRFGWCVLLAAAGEGLLVVPLAMAASSETGSWRPLGLICLGTSAVLARRAAGRSDAPGDGLQRVWRDFRNWFGIVWSRRIMERFNQHARQQQWAVRLEPGGFVADAGAGDPPRNSRDAERFLRWLLRRFVDDEWIDARIGRSPSETQNPGSG